MKKSIGVSTYLLNFKILEPKDKTYKNSSVFLRDLNVSKWKRFSCSIREKDSESTRKKGIRGHRVLDVSRFSHILFMVDYSRYYQLHEVNEILLYSLNTNHNSDSKFL